MNPDQISFQQLEAVGSSCGGFLAPHGHVLAPDGVWVRDDEGGLEFHALPEPTVAEIAQLAERAAARLQRVFEAHGKSFEQPLSDSEQLWLEHPALGSCYQAAAAGGSSWANIAGAVPALRATRVSPMECLRVE